MAGLGHRRRLTGTLGALTLVAVGLGYVPQAEATDTPTKTSIASKIEAPGTDPMPVADPDTIAFRNKAGDRRYLTYGTSVDSKGKACGGPIYPGNKKDCWIPYVAHGRNGTVGSSGTVDGDALPNGPGRWAAKASGGLWAPSVVRFRGQYYLFYTATLHGTQSEKDPRGRKCIGVAEAVKNSPKRFKARPNPLLCKKGGWMIDADAVVAGRQNTRLFVVFRDDGAAKGKETALSVARLSDSVRYRPGTKHTILRSTRVGWEAFKREDGKTNHIIENPSLIRSKGQWWLFYSGYSWRSPKYATGLAVCGKSPRNGRCRPVPDRDRPLFGYQGADGHQKPHKPVAGLPGNKAAPGALSVFRAHNGGLRAVWHYRTFPKKGRSMRYSLTGKLTHDTGRLGKWRVK